MHGLDAYSSETVERLWTFVGGSIVPAVRESDGVAAIFAQDGKGMLFAPDGTGIERRFVSVEDGYLKMLKPTWLPAGDLRFVVERKKRFRKVGSRVKRWSYWNAGYFRDDGTCFSAD